MDTVTISVAVAIIGCVVGVLGWARNASKDESDLAASIAAIQTSISYIEADIREIKNDFRRMETDVHEAQATATKALTVAKSAHERIDMLVAEKEGE